MALLRDGADADADDVVLVLELMALIERLCALVPPPRKKLLTYHGVFAPAASAWDRVVPPVVGADGDGRRRRGRTEVVEAPAAEEQEFGRWCTWLRLSSFSSAR